MSPVSASSGYPSPTVAVASTLPKRKVASSVLIVPIVSGDDDGPATVVANPYLDAEAVLGHRRCGPRRAAPSEPL